MAAFTQNPIRSLLLLHFCILLMKNIESFNALVFHRTADYNIRHEDLRVKREFSLLFHSLSKDAREEESWKGMLASTSTRIRLTIVTTLTIWKWVSICLFALLLIALNYLRLQLYALV